MSVTDIGDAPSAATTTDETPAKKAPAKKAAKKPAAKKTAKKVAKKATKAPAKKAPSETPADPKAGSDKYEKPMPLDAEIFKPQSLALDMKGVEFEEWARLGLNLRNISTGHQWWLGDWFVLGEDKWSEQAFGVFDLDDDYESTTIQQFARVARAIPEKDRRHELSWTHHKSVCALSPTLRRKALKWAINNGKNGRPASDAELRAYVKTLKGDEAEVDSKDPKTEHTYRVSWRLQATEENLGESLLKDMEEVLKRKAAEYGVDLRGVESAKS